MPHLIPHVLFRSLDELPSPAALALHRGGYLLTFATRDTLAIPLAASGKFEAVVVDTECRTADMAAQSIATRVAIPVVVISCCASRLPLRSPNIHVVTPADVEEDIVSVVDRAIASHERSWASLSALSA